jgi:histone-lysine N-methyltransferase SETMAR
MEKLEIRAVIKYLYKKGLKGDEIHTDMVNVLGNDAPSRATVFNWLAEFKRGRSTIDDEPRSGRPKTATTEEIIEYVHDMVIDDRRLTKQEIADAMGISTERVLHILKNELGLRKLLTRWVPHSLTLDQKRIRVRLSQQHLDRFRKNKTDFVRRFITMDETWVYHYDPELRQQTAEWTEPGCSAPKQVKGSKSSKKIMASVFWDAKGILMIDYLQTGKTITGEYYCSLLDQLDVKIREKRPGLKKKKIIFHQDNAPAHKSALTISKLTELKYELLEHPPYSPDLAPSDFHLFPNLKKSLRGKRFSSNEEVIAAIEGYFEGLPENHFSTGIHELENRWNKCIELKGDYIEE